MGQSDSHYQYFVNHISALTEQTPQFSESVPIQ